MPVRNIVVLAASLAVAACALSGAPTLIEVPSKTAQPVRYLGAVFSDEQAAASVVDALRRELEFPTFPVTFQYFPSRDAFERALVLDGYSEAMARPVARTLGAIAGYRRVLFNESLVSSFTWAEKVNLYAHELTHALQYELGGGRRGTSDQWLREGAAEWVAARVIEAFGVQSMAVTREGHRRALAATARPDRPERREMVTFADWVALGERRDIAPYSRAFLDVDGIITRHGIGALWRYFAAFADSTDRLANFQSAFGEALTD